MSSLGNFVWGVADLLRGPYRPNQYGEVILPMTILRRLECVMEPHREAMAKVMAEYEAEAPRRTHVRRATSLTFYNSSAFTLATALEDPDNLAANLVNYINGFSSEIDIFKHFEFEAQIRNLDTVERLAPVVREFAKIVLILDHLRSSHHSLLCLTS